jgi:hypothetical protein
MNSLAHNLFDEAGNEITSSVPNAFAWRETLPGAQLGHYFRLSDNVTERTPRLYIYQAIGKALCHVLISALPQDAVPEASENLMRLYQFYNSAAVAALQEPTTRHFNAAFGARTIRPDIDIAEE